MNKSDLQNTILHLNQGCHHGKEANFKALDSFTGLVFYRRM